MSKAIEELQEKAREVLKREFELAGYLDKHSWQTGYPKIKNQLGKKVDVLIEQAYEQAQEDEAIYWQEETKKAIQEETAKLREALIWCSEAEDFQEGGKARDGWLKICKPLLDKTN